MGFIYLFIILHFIFSFCFHPFTTPFYSVEHLGQMEIHIHTPQRHEDQCMKGIFYYSISCKLAQSVQFLA